MTRGAESIVHGIRSLMSDIQTVSRVVFFKQVQDKSPSSSHGCGSVMDNNIHTCSSEVQTQFPLPVGPDKVTPWDPFSSALQSSPLEEASTQVQSLTT